VILNRQGPGATTRQRHDTGHTVLRAGSSTPLPSLNAMPPYNALPAESGTSRTATRGGGSIHPNQRREVRRNGCRRKNAEGGPDRGKVWDRRALDRAVDTPLGNGEDTANPWDELFVKTLPRTAGSYGTSALPISNELLTLPTADRDCKNGSENSLLV
jgi:hypothetical protein